MLKSFLGAAILAQLATVFLAPVAIAAPTAALADRIDTPKDAVVDHLGVPGPIAFDGTSYELAWSSRPAPNYIKQEYVPSGQNVERYTRMLLVEAVTGGVKTVDAVRNQVDMLNKRKSSDPLVKMNIIQNESTGEVLLDFLVSSKDANGEYVVEWNGYRYAPYRSVSGQSGVLLNAISHRAYGNENAKAFMSGLKELRAKQIKALAGMALSPSNR